MSYQDEIAFITRQLDDLLKPPVELDNTETKYQTVNCEKHGEFVQRIRSVTLLNKKITTTRTRCPLCMEERLEELQELSRRSDFIAMEGEISRLMSMLEIPERFVNCTLDNYIPVNDDSATVLRLCRGYAERWPERLKSGGGMVMCGKPGTGKNHLAIAIAKHVIREFRSSVGFTTALRIARNFKSTWSKNSSRTEDEVIEQYTSRDLLIIDEVGVQFGSDAEKLIMFEIINTRYERMKPTILISNQTREELSAFIGERVIDRMNDGGGCTLAFTWESYRDKK